MGTPRPGTTSATDSPAATAAAAILMDHGGFGYTGGLGMGSGLTPRGTGLTPMALQMSGGMSSVNGTVTNQDQEEDRKRRIEGIVGLISGRWGFVSQEGVERCAARLGLECLWEEGMGDERRRILSVAGHGVLVEIEFGKEEVLGVVLSFPESDDSVGSEASEGATILQKDLRGKDGGYIVLDCFVDNLERLATMDRLGGEGISCFNAVDGIRKSLERIFVWEIERMKRQKQEGAEEEVICRCSGRPKLHTRRRVGLALQYWMEGRFLTEKKHQSEEMDIDSNAKADSQDEPSIWSAIIECEASPAEFYPAIRTSDTWVSEAVEKPAPMDTGTFPTSDHQIDWQEPPPMLLSSNYQLDDPTNNNPSTLLQPKAPDVRFIAKFEPPVIMPAQTAVRVYEMVDLPLPQGTNLLHSYESLVFADIDAQNPPLSTPRTVEKATTSYDTQTNTSTTHKHKTTLFVQRPEVATAITYLPFSHPRQIIATLPILRQWIMAATFLRNSFLVTHNENPPTSSANGEHSTERADPTSSPAPAQFQTVEDELAAFLASPLPTNDNNDPTNPSNSSKGLDITLSTTPSPRFSITFPNPRHGGKLTSIVFTIGLNGAIEGVDVDDGGGRRSAHDGEAAVGKVEEEKVRRVLEIGESVDVLVEWMVG